jgi:hypothetical protein
MRQMTLFSNPIVCNQSGGAETAQALQYTREDVTDYMTCRATNCRRLAGAAAHFKCAAALPQLRAMCAMRARGARRKLACMTQGM